MELKKMPLSGVAMALNLIDQIFEELQVGVFQCKAVNLLLPVNANSDVPLLLPSILNGLKSLLSNQLDSYLLDFVFNTQFKAFLDLKPFFPDKILGFLLNLCYVFLFEIEEISQYGQHGVVEVMLLLLKKSKNIEKTLFSCDWRKFFVVIDSFVYPKLPNMANFTHQTQIIFYDTLISVAKKCRRFYDVEAFDQVMKEFEPGLNPYQPKGFLRSCRYISLFVPFENLTRRQLDRLLQLLNSQGPLAGFRCISSFVDHLYSFLLSKVVKHNFSQLSFVDWSLITPFLFECILPSALKIPSPVKSERKLQRLFHKSGKNPRVSIFQSVIGKSTIDSIGKLLVYFMRMSCYADEFHPRIINCLKSLRNLCQPTNHGPWSGSIDSFLHNFVGKMARLTEVDSKFKCCIKEELIDEIVASCWILLEKMLYSRLGPAFSGISLTCVTCNYLICLRPHFVMPKLIDLISVSLQNISEPSKTTSSIGILHLTMPNLLNWRKSDLALAPIITLLPVILQGIDCNDELKSFFTFATISNFSEGALIRDISGACLNDVTLSEGSQQAKEFSSQFMDIYLLFTANLISYVRSVGNSSSNSKELTVDKGTLEWVSTVADNVYSHASEEIASRCAEKWVDFFTSEQPLLLAEFVGSIMACFPRKFPKLIVPKLFPIVAESIRNEIGKGAGRFGVNDEANKALIGYLSCLTSLALVSRECIQMFRDCVFELCAVLLKECSQRRVFAKVSTLLAAVCHTALCPKLILSDPVISTDSNPFTFWGRWLLAEDLLGEDAKFNWEMAQKKDVEDVFELFSISKQWFDSVLLCLSSSDKKTSESIQMMHCVLSYFDFILEKAIFLHQIFSSKLNESVNTELADKSINLLKALSEDALSFYAMIQSSESTDLLIEYMHLMSGLTTRTLQRPFDKLKMNYERFPRDKSRSIACWAKRAEGQCVYRIGLPSILGDDCFDSIMNPLYLQMMDVLLDLSFRKFHVVRAIAQSHFRRFIHKNRSFARPYATKIFDKLAVAADGNLSEEEFKGFCFLFKGEFYALFSCYPDLYIKYMKIIVNLSGHSVANSIHNSSMILIENVSGVIANFVPNDRITKPVACELVPYLLGIAQSSELKTTQQLCLHASVSLLDLIEDCSEFLILLLKLSTSNVVVIRNLSLNCFKRVVYQLGKKVGKGYWDYVDLDDFDDFRNELKLLKPVHGVVDVSTSQFTEIMRILLDYYEWLCLNESEESGDRCELSTFQCEHIGRIVNMLNAQQLREFLNFLKTLFLLDGQALPAGKQRALAETLVGIIGNANVSCDEEWKGIRELLLKSWHCLPIENVHLWCSAIDNPIMWNEYLLREVSDLFHLSLERNDKTRILLSLKMSFLIYRRLGRGAESVFPLLHWKDFLIDLMTHEQSSIVGEASTLLALLCAFNVERVDLDLELKSRLQALRSEEEFPRFARGLLQYSASLSTCVTFSHFWRKLIDLMDVLLPLLCSEDVQLLSDAKKAFLTLFLTKDAEYSSIMSLTEVILNFVTQGEIPSKTRKYCLELVQLLIQNNFSVIRVQGFMEKCASVLLESKLIELRESSLGILTSLYRIDCSCCENDSKEIAKSLESGKTIRSIKTDEGVIERHAMVLRASAIILSEPYSIPSYLPKLLTTLSRFISDRSPIAPLVRSTFSEFRRTHMDNWTEDREKFTENELDAIGELLTAPSYYA